MPAKLLEFDHDCNIEEIPVGRVQGHFLDSGAYSLWTLAAKKYAEEHNCDPLAYYRSDVFLGFLEGYAKFIKKQAHGIDLYANVDVIPPSNLDPGLDKKRIDECAEITYRTQKYLEKEYNLTPIPVVHYKTQMKWLKKYVAEGYEMIGIGGLVGSARHSHCRLWLEHCFDVVCPPPSYKPKVKLHGFGVTDYSLLVEFPWYSADSTSWTKAGAFGTIRVPKMRTNKKTGKKEFCFWTPGRDGRPEALQPRIVTISVESSLARKSNAHYLTIPEREQQEIQQWLRQLGVALGDCERHSDGTIKRDANWKPTITEFGVMTRHTERRAANLLFYEELRKSLPEYPWRFRSKQRKGLRSC